MTDNSPIQEHDSNAGIAFGMVLGAAASTALGASVVLLPAAALLKYASRKNLAAALAFAAGVMLYVSFAEILPESKEHFLDAEFSDKEASLYSTLCFFVGVLLMIGLNSLVNKLLGAHDHDVTLDGLGHDHHHHHHHHHHEHRHRQPSEKTQATTCGQPTITTTAVHVHRHDDGENDDTEEHNHHNNHDSHHSHHLHHDVVTSVLPGSDDVVETCCQDNKRREDKGPAGCSNRDDKDTANTVPVSVIKTGSSPSSSSSSSSGLSLDECCNCKDHPGDDNENNNNGYCPVVKKVVSIAETATPAEVTVTKRVAAYPASLCHSEDPASELLKFQRMAEEIQIYEQRTRQPWSGHERSDKDKKMLHSHILHGIAGSHEQEAARHTDGKFDVEHGEEGKKPAKVVEETAPTQTIDGLGTARTATTAETIAIKTGMVLQEGEGKDLVRMSMNTAIAFALHNFPEGLATFVAGVNNPEVGAVLAIAIAMHNLPEGVCVALPIYYATGSRWKAFGCAVLSALSQPAAALLGWVVLAHEFSNTLYGVLFGFVAGMMVIIAMRELLPTAHRYDPDDSTATFAFLFGMAFMAFSLMLFLL